MTRRYGTAPHLLLDGQAIEGPLRAQIISATITLDLNAPSSCEVVFSDPERRLLDDLSADFGQDLEVHASPIEGRAEQPVFTGHVYGLEFQADEAGCYSIIRGYDATYRLRQCRAITSYNDTTDADLVRQLCEEAGVEVGDIKGGDESHAYIAQLNESHWDFLSRRAEATGATLHAIDGKIQFRPLPGADYAPDPGDHESRDPLQLTPGRNLVYLRSRLSSAQQIEEVEVRGWDPKAKREVTARNRVETETVAIDHKPDETAGEHGARLRVAGRPGLTKTSECEAMSASYAKRLATAFSFLEGKAYGDPQLVAGCAVSLGRSGRFDGRYTLSSARHVFDQDGYFTYVTVSGEHDRSLYGLLRESAGPALPGLYPAVVTNISDPDKMGRVRLRLPWLSDDFETNWCRVMQVGAGPERGLLIFPEVDDEVLVSFIGGDVSHPVVVGGMFNGVDKPPSEGYEDAGDGTVDTRALRSRVGHLILLSDKGGEERIELQTSDQSVVIKLDQAASGALVIETDGDVSVVAGGAANVEAGRDVTAKSDMNVTIEAGMNATVKASANLALEAGGTVDIKGALINLN